MIANNKKKTKNKNKKTEHDYFSKITKILGEFA